MRKQYLLWMALLLPSWQLSAQTYCTPTAGASSQANYLKNAIFSDQGALYYDATSYQAYVDNSAQMVTSYPGGTVDVHLEHSIGGVKSYVWVDWNSDGDFDDFYENPISPSNFNTVDEQFFIPPSQLPGIYRIRVQSGSTLPSPVNPCGPNNYGGFVDFSLKIEPTPTCWVPSALTASNVTNSTAVISWTEPSMLPGSGYEYYYTSSSTPPSVSTPASGTSTQTSAPISGLTSFTSYYIYARSVCDASSKSAWSVRGTFRTKCDPMTSLFENFENVANGANANCWDKLGAGYFTISNGSGANNSKGVTQSSSSSANPSVAILPVFSNVNAGTHWLRFKAKVSSDPGVLNIGYITDDTDLSTFTTIQSVNITNKIYDGYEYNVVIPNTVPANARLAIRHNGVPAVNIYWDEVYWEPKPTCLPVSGVTTSNITSSSVDVAWAASVSSPAGYDIYYSLNNTPPTATTLPNITNVAGNSYTIANLAPAKTYYIWVRPRCSSTNQGPWSSINSILTACAPVSDLTENFDSYSNGFITNAPCWGRLTVGLIASCNIDGNTPAASGNRHISLRSISSGDIAIAVLPQFSNINAGTHQLRFKAYSTLATGKLKVGYVTDPANASSFVLIQQLDITNTSYNANYYTVSVPNTVPANARLAIRSDFETSAKAVYYIDDLYWETASLGTAETTAAPEFMVYPNPFTDTITISADQKVSSMAVYDISGKLIREIANPSASVSLRDLQSGVYLIKVLFKNGTAKTIKAVKK